MNHVTYAHPLTTSSKFKFQKKKKNPQQSRENSCIINDEIQNQNYWRNNVCKLIITPCRVCLYIIISNVTR